MGFIGGPYILTGLSSATRAALLKTASYMFLHNAKYVGIVVSEYEIKVIDKRSVKRSVNPIISNAENLKSKLHAYTLLIISKIT